MPTVPLTPTLSRSGERGVDRLRRENTSPQLWPESLGAGSGRGRASSRIGIAEREAVAWWLGGPLVWEETAWGCGTGREPSGIRKGSHRKAMCTFRIPNSALRIVGLRPGPTPATARWGGRWSARGTENPSAGRRRIVSSGPVPVQHPDLVSGQLRLHGPEGGLRVHLPEERGRAGASRPPALILGNVLGNHPGVLPPVQVENWLWHVGKLADGS